MRERAGLRSPPRSSRPPPSWWPGSPAHRHDRTGAGDAGRGRAGPGGDPVPPADPVPPGDPVPPVEPAPSPDAVPAAATAAGTRALRHQFDAEAKTALAELLAAGADCPPGLADPDAATAPKTW